MSAALIIVSNFNSFSVLKCVDMKIRADVQPHRIFNSLSQHNFIVDAALENHDHYLITFLPKQTLISSTSSFMCRTIFLIVWENLQFMRIISLNERRWRRIQPHLISGICYKFSMAFHCRCCVFIFFFQRRSSRTARICNNRDFHF